MGGDKHTAEQIGAQTNPADQTVIRMNPRSDRFNVKRFHHVELWCADATNCSRRFSCGLGMPIVAKSDISTGNKMHSSYLLRSGQLSLLFTAPYTPISSLSSSASIPTFTSAAFSSFHSMHGGIAVRAIAVEVEDASQAFSSSVSAGAIPISPPILLTQNDNTISCLIAEVQLYGDVVLRYVSYINKKNATPTNFLFLPNFTAVANPGQSLDFGLRSLDHVAGNVLELGPTVEYLKQFTGFHELAEFTGDDIGTVESGSNVVVLANNNENVLLPVNEPVRGTKKPFNLTKLTNYLTISL